MGYDTYLQVGSGISSAIGSWIQNMQADKAIAEDRANQKQTTQDFFDRYLRTMMDFDAATANRQAARSVANATALGDLAALNDDNLKAVLGRSATLSREYDNMVNPTIKGYEDRYKAGIDYLKSSASKSASDTSAEYDKQKAGLAKSLKDRGMNVSSISDAMNRGVDKAKADDLDAQAERLQTELFNADQSLSGDLLNAKGNAAAGRLNLLSQTTGDILNTKRQGAESMFALTTGQRDSASAEDYSAALSRLQAGTGLLGDYLGYKGKQTYPINQTNFASDMAPVLSNISNWYAAKEAAANVEKPKPFFGLF